MDPLLEPTEARFRVADRNRATGVTYTEVAGIPAVTLSWTNDDVQMYATEVHVNADPGGGAVQLMLRLLLTLAAVVLVVACSGREPLGESEYLVWCADFADRQADRIGVTPWSVEVTEGMVAEAFAEYNAHVSEDVGQLPVLLRLSLESIGVRALSWRGCAVRSGLTRISRGLCSRLCLSVVSTACGM